jgi:lysophospholipase L1-like esterase
VVAAFVALGDSITLGIGDPVADPALGTDGWRGWARLLADSLPGVRLHNFAASGALAGDVECGQLPRALELRPALAAVIVGVNDTLRHDFDPSRVTGALAHTVGALRAAGALVLTMKLPDAGRMLGLPRALANPLARRMAVVNDAIDELAARFDTVHFDAAGHPDTYDRRMWSVDRLHPGERGHRFIAGEYHALLAARGFPVGPPPDSEPTSPPPTRSAQLRWLATKGTRWLLDRSTDLLPGLLLLAAREALGRPTRPADGPGASRVGTDTSATSVGTAAPGPAGGN